MRISESMLELGIAILPDKDTTQEALRLNGLVLNALNSTHLQIEPTKNIPHISLYHMAADESHVVQIIEILQSIWKNSPGFTIKMDKHLHLIDKLYYVFWNAEQAKSCPHMKELLKKVINQLCPLRSKTLLQHVADSYEKFSLHDKKLVDQYGVSFGLPDISFNPHITLLYNTSIGRLNSKEIDVQAIKTVIEEVTPSRSFEFAANKMVLAELGYQGNIINMIEEF
jgi:2'-5' RNA ligase